METKDALYLGIELKFRYLEEFKICGIPIPACSKDPDFVLKFPTAKSYHNYRIALKTILYELKLADPKKVNYEIQHSKTLVEYILYVLGVELLKEKTKQLFKTTSF